VFTLNSAGLTWGLCASDGVLHAGYGTARCCCCCCCYHLQAGDAWGALRARQEVLALAKVHVSMNRDSNPFPLLLPTAHYKLAQAYAELGCVAQVAEHSQRWAQEATNSPSHLAVMSSKLPL
jgi:hypothetical protein